MVDGSITAAVNWVDQLLTGPLANCVAALAVAVVGALLLGGRLPVRRGAAVVIGCFVLFGASVIAHGLVAGLTSRDAGAMDFAFDVAELPTPRMTPAPRPYDPYAGVGVPSQQEQPLIR